LGTVFEKEKGFGNSSPGCSSSISHFMVLPSNLGGVPVFNLPTLKPSDPKESDIRLYEKGCALGLHTDEELGAFLIKKNNIREELKRLESTMLTPSSDTNRVLRELGSAPLKKPQSLKEILRRPEISYRDLGYLNQGSPLRENREDVICQIEMDTKYEGYIKRQKEQIDKFKKLENLRIPESFSYEDIPGLSREIVQKLSNVRPSSLGQASRVSGITPAAVSVLMVYLKRDGIQTQVGVYSTTSS